MSTHVFETASAEATWHLAGALGETLAEAADRGLVIALDGDLGAGKTVFVKGLAEGLGIAGDVVSSPTFVIAQRYEGGVLRLHHIDLYRIDDEDELLGFGFDEMLDPPNVAAIEWACRFPASLPADRLSIRIDRGRSDEARRFEVEPGGARSNQALEAWIRRARESATRAP